MTLSSLLSPEILALGLALLGLGMASTPGEERARAREEARLAQEAERERKRQEVAERNAEARLKREQDAEMRKSEMEANRLARMAERQANRHNSIVDRESKEEALEQERDTYAPHRLSREEQQAKREALLADKNLENTIQSANQVHYDRNIHGGVKDDGESGEQHYESFDSPSVFREENILPLLHFDHTPDQGIMSDFQGQHLARGVFSALRIDNLAPDPSLVLEHFDLGSALKVRLFLEQSLRNKRIDLGDYELYNPDRSTRIQVNFLLDGQEVAQFVETIANKEQLRSWTSWWHSLVADAPGPWNGSNINYEQTFGGIIQTLAPGEYRFAIEWWMIPDSGYEPTEHIATAELVLAFDEYQYAAWLARHGAQTLQQHHHAGAGAAVASPIRVSVRNSCGHEIKYQVVQGASTSNTSLSKNSSTSWTLNPGDKILVDGRPIFMASAGLDGQTVFLCK